MPNLKALSYKKNVLQIINYFLMIAAWTYLYVQLQNRQDLFLQITDLWGALQKKWAIILLVFVLMLLNWSLEAKKWQILIVSLAKVSFVQSLKSVWVGLAFATFIPLGNWLGRAKAMATIKSEYSAGAWLLSSFFQFWVTLFFGVWAAYFFWSFGMTFLVACLTVLLTVLLSLVFLSKTTERYLQNMQKHKFWNWCYQNLLQLNTFRKDIHLKVFGLSLLRYCVFIVQIFLLFKVFELNLSFLDIAIGSALLFVSKSLLPVGGFIVGLSVREASAYFFFSALGEERVIALMFLLWIINIAIPVLIGSVWNLFSKDNSM